MLLVLHGTESEVCTSPLNCHKTTLLCCITGHTACIHMHYPLAGAPRVGDVPHRKGPPVDGVTGAAQPAEAINAPRQLRRQSLRLLSCLLPCAAICVLRRTMAGIQRAIRHHIVTEQRGKLLLKAT